MDPPSTLTKALSRLPDARLSIDNELCRYMCSCWPGKAHEPQSTRENHGDPGSNVLSTVCSCRLCDGDSSSCRTRSYSLHLSDLSPAHHDDAREVYGTIPLMSVKCKRSRNHNATVSAGAITACFLRGSDAGKRDVKRKIRSYSCGWIN